MPPVNTDVAATVKDRERDRGSGIGFVGGKASWVLVGLAHLFVRGGDRRGTDEGTNVPRVRQTTEPSVFLVLF